MLPVLLVDERKVTEPSNTPPSRQAKPGHSAAPHGNPQAIPRRSDHSLERATRAPLPPLRDLAAGRAIVILVVISGGAGIGSLCI